MSLGLSRFVVGLIQLVCNIRISNYVGVLHNLHVKLNQRRCERKTAFVNYEVNE